VKDEDFLEMFNQVRTIRSRVEGIESTQEILVRAEIEDIVPPLLARMREDILLAKIYLKIDGVASQKEIAAALDTSEMTVSRKVDKLLKDEHIIVLVDRTAKGKIYDKAPVERILNLSRRVRKEFKL
jgi:CO dehydrogenase/acetyl-CoA synthase alpha subunit